MQCPDNLKATTDKKEVIKESQLLLLVVPTPHVAEVLGDDTPQCITEIISYR
jgi:glycerol-3-phosphate dehydrogenase